LKPLKIFASSDQPCVQIFLACSSIGAYATLLNYAYTPAELAETLCLTTPKVLFTTFQTSRYQYSSTLSYLANRLEFLEKFIILPDCSGSSDPAEHMERFMRFSDFQLLGCPSDSNVTRAKKAVRPQDIVNLQFTSGSTGRPKAAALTHRGMINSARYIALEMGLTSKDRIAIPVPLFHAFGLIIGSVRVSFHEISCANTLQGYVQQ
jgi:mevalonyl-CoA ligase